jgi:hypothetical protein
MAPVVGRGRQAIRTNEPGSRDDRGTRRSAISSDATVPGGCLVEHELSRAKSGVRVLSAGSGRARRAVSAAVMSLFLVACGTSSVTPGSTSPASATMAPSSFAPSSFAPSSVAPSSPEPAGPTASARDVPGFPFTADAITGYYETQGYACTAPAPSTKAPRYSVRTCQLVDDAGRTRVIGVVTDPAGGLADGWASVRGTPSEPVLAPSDALGPFAGFLGAMLGQDAGTSLLPWLASHLGDAHAETTSGTTRVAVYTASPTDHATLYVEVASPTYSASPGVPAP